MTIDRNGVTMRHFVYGCSPLVLSALLSCTGTAHAPRELSDADRMDITELVVWRLLDLSWQGEEVTVCVTIDGGVASAEFVERFADAAVTVVSTRGCDDTRSRESGKAIQVNVDDIEQTSRDGVSVEGSYVTALLSGKGFIFRLERSEGSWIILSEELDWIARLKTAPIVHGIHEVPSLCL
jgi:hypothetical protein